MKESEATRSLLFSIGLEDSVDVVDEPQRSEAEGRLGKWTEPLYICSKATGCQYLDTCRHAKPHRELHACGQQWMRYLGLRMRREEDPVIPGIWWIRAEYYGSFFIDDNSYRQPTGRWCANCVAIPDSRRFVPLAKPRLSENNKNVICPSAIDSCIGRCHHATPHTKSRFCKDLFPNGEARLHCRPMKSAKHGSSRGLLFDTPTLACQK